MIVQPADTSKTDFGDVSPAVVAEPNTPQSRQFGSERETSTDTYKGQFGTLRFVHREDGKPVAGLVVGKRTRKDPWSVILMGTLPDYQRRGIMTGLFQRAAHVTGSLSDASEYSADGQAFRVANPGYFKELRESLSEDITLTPSEEFGDAYQDVTVPGVATKFFTVRQKDDALELTHLYTETQGIGHGRQAYQALEQWARRNGITQIYLESVDDAVGFWEKMGFEPEGESSEEGWVRMVKYFGVTEAFGDDVVYHSTPHSFDKFQIAKDDIGVHFGNKQQAAWRYNRMQPNGSFGKYHNLDPVAGGRTIPARLNIKNPLRLPDLGEWTATSIRSALRRSGRFPQDKLPPPGATREQLRQALLDAGFDGIVYVNKHEGLAGGFRRLPSGDSYIALSPENIKNAFEAAINDAHATWPQALQDWRAIGDFMAEQAGNADFDEEMASEYFRGAKGVLKTFNVADLREGDANHNIPNPRKQAKYAKMPATTMPPIVVEAGEVIDGNHRLRAARQRGDETILGYDIVDAVSEGVMIRVQRLDVSESIEATLDWIRRSDLEIQEGAVTLYHATPRPTAKTIEREGLREGSKLTDSPSKSAFFAARDRDLTPKQIVVFQVRVPVDAFTGGIWALLDRPLGPEHLTRVQTPDWNTESLYRMPRAGSPKKHYKFKGLAAARVPTGVNFFKRMPSRLVLGETARQLIEALYRDPKADPALLDAVQALTDQAEADPAIETFTLQVPHGRWLELNQIRVKPEARNQGVGSKYISAVKALAKQFGLKVILGPEADRGHKADLERFYRGHGFAPHKGRNRDYSIGGAFGGEWIHRP